MHTILGLSPEVYVINLVLAIPVFFVVRRLARRFIHQERYVRTATWLATILATPLLYAGIVVAFFFVGMYYPHRGFDRTRWLSDTEKRFEMSGDIIGSGMLLGKSKEEVVEILGPADTTDADVTYYLGFTPMGMIDPDYLVVRFDEGKVVKVTQHGS